MPPTIGRAAPQRCVAPRWQLRRLPPALCLAVAGLAIPVGPAVGREPPPRVYRDSVAPHWFADRTRFWYRNDLAGGAREFVLVDPVRATRQPAFDHEVVARALSEATGRTVTADRLPIERLEFADQGNSVVLRGIEQSWRLDLDSSALQSCDDSPAPPGPAVPQAVERRSRRTGEETRIAFVNRTGQEVRVYWLDDRGSRRFYAAVQPDEEWDQHTYAGHVWLVMARGSRPLGVFEATETPSVVVLDRDTIKQVDDDGADPSPRRGSRRATSPDGKWTVVVRDNNLYLNPTEGGEELALSDDGRPTDAYSLEDVRWSPDSTKLAALRTEEAERRIVYLIESSPDDQVQPRLQSYDYLKPGDRIAHPRPQLFDVAQRRKIPVRDELFANPWSIEHLRWAADSSRFTFEYNQRGHQLFRIVAIDAQTGAASTVLEERSDTFICYSGKYFCEWIGDAEIVWMSERSGWNHLWRFDGRTGQNLGPITQGEWVVQSVTHVDAEKRQIWFLAGGIRPEQDPYFSHFCRVNFDGSGLTVLTAGDGTHDVSWSPGDAYFLDTWSRVDCPPVTELRRADDGALVCPLETADAGEVLAARGGRWPERFVAKGRDGQTDIYGILIRPRDFDPRGKYPVVENIYAGPQAFSTPKAFRARFGPQQELADRGLIVVQCDGQGTAGRSKKFHDVCWRNLRDAGFPDRIAWIKAAAAQDPSLDISRVGIYGGSAGGQNALAALLWHNDFYRVAVADCGCHDNRMDKIWWNEQWMGWPIGDHYAENSNTVNAHLLQGRLLLIVGELDRNVDPASTMQVVRALQKADKDFDLVVVVGSGHGAAETPYGSRRRADFLIRHLLGEQPGG